MKIKDAVRYFDQKFPQEIACDFDKENIGFIMGNQEYELRGILFALDLTIEVAMEAVQKGCNLIVTHHPFLFDPLKKIIYTSPKGKIVEFVIKNDLSLYSMHTNLDAGANGVNDTLGKLLGIESSEYNIATKDKLLRAGTIKKMTLEQLVEHVKEVLHVRGVKVIGDLQKTIERVGILGGSGAYLSDIDNAVAAACDCYITGEIKLSNAIYAKQLGLAMIEVNHGVEKHVFYEIIDDAKRDLCFEDIYISLINTDPLQYM